MKKVILFVIRAYQTILSPLFPPSCRFYPSCSQYALESISRFGCVKGGVLAVKRILKCHPFHEGGFDPAPRPESKRRNII